MLKSPKYLFIVFVITASLVFGNVTPVYAVAIPAEINKQFTPISIDAGAVSVLRVTVFNPNTFDLTSVSWSDNLIGVQSGLSIANPAGATTNCAGGTVTAVSGTTNLSLSGATVPAQVGSTPGECYVEVNVTSTTPGNLINTIPTNNLVATGDDDGTSVSITNTSPASATLTVIAVTPPSLTKGFAPNTIFVGELSQLTITINNNDSDTNLTNTSYTDTLPTGVVLASPISAVVTNCGAYTLNAIAGGSTIQLTNATVTPSQNCIVQVNVTGTSGQYTNTIPAGPGGPGSISTNQGVTNLSPASDNLNIQPIGLIKSFSPNSIVAGGSSILTITLQNPTGSAYTNVGLTDNLPAGLQVSGVPTTTCTGGTVTNTVSSVTLTGGTVPASATPPTPLGTCTISVPVFSPLTTTPATLTNTIPANSITAAQPGVTNFFPATGNITVTAPLTGTKAYSPTSIVVGGVSTVTITLTNNSATDLTNVNFTDTLPTNLTVSGTPSSPQCNGTITNTATSVTLAGGSILAGTSCTIVFNVTSSVAGSGTTYENTIPTNNITTAQGIGNSSTIRTGTDLTVVNSATLPVGVSKAFQTSPITPGQPTRLRITITAPVDTNLTGLNIVDTLPTGLVIIGTASVPPAPANPTDNCTGANVVAPIGGNTITLTGASILANGNCQITVYVTSSIPEIYNNIIPANTITTTEGRTNIVDSNTATVVVTSMSMSKAFYPDIVQANGLSTLTITLQNTTTSPLINVSVTDNLPFTNATNGVFVAPVPNASTTCSGGVITATPGSSTITMTSAVVPAQVGGVPGICTISVDVQGRDSTPVSPSTRTNTIPTTNVSGTVQSTGTVINPIAQAQDDLFIQPLTIGAVKGFDPVLVYGSATSTMTVQLNNPNNATLTGIAFTDNMALLASGIVLANPVNFNVGTCGGTLIGNPGDSSFSFSGGTLLPNSSCSITLSVVMQVNGNRTNRIPAGAVTTFNGVSNPDPTEASLTNLPGVSVVKVFNPDTILVGQPTTLTITIENTNSIPVVDMALTDNLPGTLPSGLEIASPNNASTTCGDTTGTPLSLTAVAGTQTISLVGAELAGNATCNIVVNVTSSQPGVYINTIPANSLTSQSGVTNNNPTTSTVTVNSSAFSLGNRVWFDTDNSATININGSEVGINGVDVQLYSVDGLGNTTFVATQTTANGGYYRFDNLPAGDYIVVIPATELGAGGTLDGYLSSSTSIAPNGTISETIAPDPDNNTDNDDNGTLQTSGPFNGGVISSTVTLGPSADEPINDTNADPTNPSGEAANSQSNRTVDFGFYRTQIGNQIFVDTNVNGTFDAGDTNLVGARVQIYSGDGLTEINVGADGILGTTDDMSGGLLTGAGGTYLFSGLPQGNYVIGVTPPAGYASTVDTASPTDTTSPNVNTNNNDNGVGLNSGQVFSNAVTMSPGSFGALSKNNVTNSDGTTYDPTLDFGFTTLLYSLGNRVWFDTDNSSDINGSEVGVDNVTVLLYAADGSGNPTGAILQTETTANGGYYRFDNLPPGNYVVVIPASQFTGAGALVGYWSSGTLLNASGVVSETIAPDPDNDVDNDDNGTRTTFVGFEGAVISMAVTLESTPSEPINDTDADPTNPAGEAVNNQSNRTVDFGFYRQTLGDIVFIDTNANGVYDSGTDTPLSGAVVQLYSSNGTEILVGADGILGTSDDGSGVVTTTGTGTYLFSGLPVGDYIVRVTPPSSSYTSTIDTFDQSDNDDPDVNADNNDNGDGTGSGVASSAIVTLTPGNAGAAGKNTVTDSNGTTANPTVDFGFLSNPGFTKSIIGTNEQHTTGNDVAIGEIVTYEIVIDLPQGTPFTNVTITDQMDKGLAFVECISVFVLGVDQTSTVCPPAVSSITDAGDLASNPANPGRQIVFTIGNVTATAPSQTITIQYRVIVLDVIENQSDVQLNNSATWAWSGGSQTTSASNVRIVEPDLDIDKSANPTNNVPLGTPIQFTLFIDHTTPASQTDAFDVVLTDILPANLEYVQCSVTYTNGLAPDTLASTYCNPGTTTTDLIFEWQVFPLGATSTITFNARLIGSPAVNTASVDWTSIPIDPQINGLPVLLSTHNNEATERWYDPLDDVNVYGVSASVAINSPTPVIDDEDLPSDIPPTGFAPNKITIVPEQPKEKVYTATNVWLEIPSLGVSMPIEGVPLVNGDWDVSWLVQQAGWLQGTAFPSWQGNSVLTSHVTLADGTDGPFAQLGTLAWGDQIIVRAYGTKYIYEVRQNRTVSPYNTTVFQHEEEAWLTLITCKNYNETTDSYTSRVAVRAVLINTEQENTYFNSEKAR